MSSPRLWDARLHAFIGRLPTTPADRWLRRLSTFANKGRLWLVLGSLLGIRKGPTRRGAIRGLGSLAFSSALVNVVLKRIFGRIRPDLENLQSHRRLRREPGSLSFPSGHSSSAAAFVTGVAMESPLAGAALAPVALGVGYSRVHVGVLGHLEDLGAGEGLRDVGCGVVLVGAGARVDRDDQPLALGQGRGLQRRPHPGRLLGPSRHQCCVAAATAPPTASPATTSPG